MNVLQDVALDSDLTKSRILLFDHQCEYIKDLYEALQHDGYTVRLVFNSSDTLTSSKSWHPDLIVIGTQTLFPPLNDVCRRLHRTGGVPVVVLSEEARESVLVAALEAGASDYVRLPRSLEEVCARLRSQLRRRHHGTQHSTCAA